MGDAPADRVIVFEVTVGPISLTPSTGAAVTVLSGTRRVELTHMSGTNEPLALLKVPQGSYTGGTITVANPEIVFIDNRDTTVKLEPPFNQAVTVSFNPALTVGANAAVVNIDLNVANALTFDALGNVTGVNISSSSFTFSSATVAANENEQEPEDGELEDTTGTVASVSGTSFTLNVATTGTQLTFTTDSNTKFDDGATLATMTTGTVVTVEGITKSDGTLYAKEVEGVENENGSELDGLISQVTRGFATTLTFVADDGSGNGMDDAKVGSTFNVDVTTAQFKVSTGNIDTSGIGGLPAPPDFPFEVSTVHAGQRVEVESVSSMSVTPMPAEKVKLLQQTVSGTVSGLSGTARTTFTLTVPADSAFAMLSGFTTVTIFWQTGTDVSNLPHAPANGDAVRVRGLLFFTPNNSSSGIPAFNLIARRITR
ncbi:MAG TPA: DUF5666 domain-containing protein [Terriglobales bacterium]|nr:DUF5666 domain-containing protein [Terriglobales bacterium]